MTFEEEILFVVGSPVEAEEITNIKNKYCKDNKQIKEIIDSLYNFRTSQGMELTYKQYNYLLKELKLND